MIKVGVIFYTKLIYLKNPASEKLFKSENIEKRSTSIIFYGNL